MKMIIKESHLRIKAENIPGYLEKYSSMLEYVGWGNGYVLVPEGHPWYGKDWNELDNLVDVHGGVTWAREVKADDIGHENWLELSEEDVGFWMVGFDTAHVFDSLEKWPKEAVIKETERMCQQAIADSGVVSGLNLIDSPSDDGLRFLEMRKESLNALVIEGDNYEEDS